MFQLLQFLLWVLPLLSPIPGHFSFLLLFPPQTIPRFPPCKGALMVGCHLIEFSSEALSGVILKFGVASESQPPVTWERFSLLVAWFNQHLWLQSLLLRNISHLFGVEDCWDHTAALRAPCLCVCIGREAQEWVWRGTKFLLPAKVAFLFCEGNRDTSCPSPASPQI